MEAVRKYRENRIARLEKRLGNYHGPARFDADGDDDANNVSNSGDNGFHGNTRIPFGLCQREGIQIGKDWTPKDAWDALAGKGYTAGDVYTELKKTGKVAPRETEEPVKMTKELKEMSKRVSDLQKAKRKFERESKKRDEIESNFKRAANLRDRTQKSIEMCKINIQKYIDEFGSEDNIPDDQEDPSSTFYHRTYKEEYINWKRLLQIREDDLEQDQAEYNKLSGELADANDKVNSIKYSDKEFDDAINEYLKKSPYAKRVQNVREILESTADQRKMLKQKTNEFEVAKQQAELYRRKAENERISMERYPEGSGMYEQLKKDYGYHLACASQKEGYANVIKKSIDNLNADLADSDNKIAKLKEGASEKEWKQIYDLCIDRDTIKESTYKELEGMHKELKGVKYINPIKYAKQPSEEAIIKKLGGLDKTVGSCVSVAYAYIANKFGINVTDFRGTKSRRVFSFSVSRIIPKIGGQKATHQDAFEAANRILTGPNGDWGGALEEGKEYFFSVGQHASMIRKVGANVEFLELQGFETDNGWHELDDSVLAKRFGCLHRKTRSGYILQQNSYLVEASKFMEFGEFVSILGYLNTQDDKQEKGEGGSIK